MGRRSQNMVLSFFGSQTNQELHILQSDSGEHAWVWSSSWKHCCHVFLIYVSPLYIWFKVLFVWSIVAGYRVRYSDASDYRTEYKYNNYVIIYRRHKSSWIMSICSFLGRNQTAKGWNDNTIAKIAKASSVSTRNSMLFSWLYLDNWDSHEMSFMNPHRLFNKSLLMLRSNDRFFGHLTQDMHSGFLSCRVFVACYFFDDRSL